MLIRIFLSILTYADMYRYKHMHILTHACKYHHPHTYTYINIFLLLISNHIFVVSVALPQSII